MSTSEGGGERQRSGDGHGSTSVHADGKNATPLRDELLAYVATALARHQGRPSNRRVDMPFVQIMAHFAGGKATERHTEPEIRETLRGLVGDGLLAWNTYAKQFGFDHHGCGVCLRDKGLLEAERSDAWQALGDDYIRSWTEPLRCHLRGSVGGSEIHFLHARIETGNKEQDEALNRSRLCVALIVLVRALKIHEHPVTRGQLQAALEKAEVVGLRARRAVKGRPPREYAISQAMERINGTLPFIQGRQAGKHVLWSSRVFVNIEFFDGDGDPLKHWDVLSVVEKCLAGEA